MMNILAINLPVILETLVLGVIASLIVALAVELWKKRRKMYHVTMSLDSSEVYSPQNKSDVCIQVDYKGKAIDNSLVIMHVSIMNDGMSDIMFKSHFADVIKISCKGYQLISVTARDDKMKPQCALMDDGATLSWEILKSGESIKLSIAAQSDSSESMFNDPVECFNSLTFEFRSDCIDTIELSQELTRADEYRRLVFNGAVMKFILMASICLLFYFNNMSLSSRYDISYDGLSYRNATLLYSPLFKKYLLSSDSAAARVLSRDDIKSIEHMIPADTKNTENRIGAIFEIVVLLTIVLSVASIILSRIRFSESKFGQGIKKTNRKKRKISNE